MSLGYKKGTFCYWMLGNKKHSSIESDIQRVRTNQKNFDE